MPCTLLRPIQEIKSVKRCRDGAKKYANNALGDRRPGTRLDLHHHCPIPTLVHKLSLGTRLVHYHYLPYMEGEIFCTEKNRLVSDRWT